MWWLKNDLVSVYWLEIEKYGLIGCKCVYVDGCVVKEEISFVIIFWYII